MANFAEEIENSIREEIEACVVGDFGPVREKESGFPLVCANVETWADARKKLDYEYDEHDGFGECHSLVIWTARQLIFIGLANERYVICHTLPRNGAEYILGFPVNNRDAGK